MRAIARSRSRPWRWAGPANTPYIRLPDPRYRFTAVWLAASDVQRR
jgi:hypothetical protein